MLSFLSILVVCLAWLPGLIVGHGEPPCPFGYTDEYRQCVKQCLQKDTIRPTISIRPLKEIRRIDTAAVSCLDKQSFWNGSQCVRRILRPARQSCNGTVLSIGKCQTLFLAECMPNYRLQNNECIANKVPVPACPLDHRFRGDRCVQTRIPICEVGYSISGNVGVCERLSSPRCPVGYAFRNGQCEQVIKIRPKCPSDTITIVVTNKPIRCERTIDICAENYTWSPEHRTCVRSERTPERFTCQNHECVLSGMQCTCVKRQCDSGFVLNGNQCIKDICPDNYHHDLERKLCRPKCHCPVTCKTDCPVTCKPDCPVTCKLDCPTSNCCESPDVTISNVINNQNTIGPKQ